MKKILLLLFLCFLPINVEASISVQSFLTSDDVTIGHLESFRATVVDAINSADGGLLQTDSVTTRALNDNANPENRWDEAFNDWVYTGLLPVTSSSLTSNIAAGTAYVRGVRVVKDATAHTYTATKRTYVDLSSTGVYSFQETNKGADPPAVTTNSIRLAMVSTDEATIAYVSDERVTSIVLSTSASTSSISDTDEDTVVDTEENADEDKIRFYTGTPKTQRADIDSGGLQMASGTDINEFSTDGDLAGNSDDAVPTERAIRSYVSPDIVSGPTSGIITDDTVAVWSGVTGRLLQRSSVTIDNSNRLLNAGQTSFSVTNAGEQSNIATGSLVTIVLDSEVYDIGDNFASNTFTAPVTGKYLLTTIVRLNQIDSAADYYQLEIATSNRTYDIYFDPGGFYDGAAYDPTRFYMGMTVIADMEVADTAILKIQQVAGAGQTDISAGDTRFMGMLLM